MKVHEKSWVDVIGSLRIKSWSNGNNLTQNDWHYKIHKWQRNTIPLAIFQISDKRILISCMPLWIMSTYPLLFLLYFPSIDIWLLKYTRNDIDTQVVSTFGRSHYYLCFFIFQCQYHVQYHLLFHWWHLWPPIVRTWSFLLNSKLINDE